MEEKTTLRILALAIVVCFSLSTGAFAAAEKNAIEVVPWVYDEYYPQIEILEKCYRQSFTKNPFQVQLLEEMPQQESFNAPIVTTLTFPAMSGKGPVVKIEYGDAIGRVWRVRVVGTAESAWAAGFYEAYAVIPQ